MNRVRKERFVKIRQRVLLGVIVSKITCQFTVDDFGDTEKHKEENKPLESPPQRSAFRSVHASRLFCTRGNGDDDNEGTLCQLLA